MKKKIVLIFTLVCMFLALAIPTFAWTTEINGNTQEFDFIENKGVVKMTYPGYFNSNLISTIKGYNYSGGVFYRNDENISGQIQGRFENNQYTVNIAHSSTFAFNNDFNPILFNLDIGNFNDTKGFSLADRGTTLTITSMDNANMVEHTWVASASTPVEHNRSSLSYNLNIDTFLETLTISKTTTFQGRTREYTCTADISMYPITYAQGLRYIIPNNPQLNETYPQFFKLEAFNVDTVTAPSTFISNPEIFTQAYNEIYPNAYQRGEADGFAEGKTEGVTQGFQSGERIGYENGYDVGFTDGEAEANEEFRQTYGNSDAITNFFNGFGSAVWNFCGNILNYEFLPDFNVGTVLFIFLGAGFVILLLKLLIGTKGGVVG